MARTTRLILPVLLLAACSGAPEPTTTEAPPAAPPVEEVTMTEVAPVVITEDACLNVPMDHAHHEAVRKGAAAPARTPDAAYMTLRHEDMDAALRAQEHVALEPRKAPAHIIPPHKEIISVKESDEVTLIAYEKKGVEVLHVVTDPHDPAHVQHVTFLHKDHVDQYNVRPGMKGHEARKMRGELKHMARKGSVFLYDERSNITYRMRVVDPTKADYTMEEVEQLEVEAIVWRNKHHRGSKG